MRDIGTILVVVLMVVLAVIATAAGLDGEYDKASAALLAIIVLELADRP